MLANKTLAVGTFVKTPSPIIVEVLSLSGLACLCLDAEHAPFDRSSIDACVMAARAGGIDVLVRVPDLAPATILNALDCGATGIVAPHIRTSEEARNLVRAAHYGPGGRGFAGSSRAAGYTTRSMKDHLAMSAETTVVIAQIEDAEALNDIEAIASTPGLDALFIGRVDLTISMGVDRQDDPRVLAAMHEICDVARRNAMPVGMFLADTAQLAYWRERGVSLFLVASDHGLMLHGARDLAGSIRGIN